MGDQWEWRGYLLIDAVCESGGGSNNIGSEDTSQDQEYELARKRMKLNPEEQQQIQQNEVVNHYGQWQCHNYNNTIRNKSLFI